jgi:hypothetical protein
MQGIRRGIVALACCNLLLLPSPSIAESYEQSHAAFPDKTATAYMKLAILWQQEVGLPASNGQSGAGDHATAASAKALARVAHPSLREVFEQDMAFSLDQASGTSQQQRTQTPTSNEPTLQGLGFPSSEIKGSAKEQALLNKRSHMLQIHQKLGLITAIPMVAALFTGPGAKGHHGLPGSPGGRNLHMGLGIATTALYAATAYYAIRAPKIPGTKSYGLIRLHKALAWVHGPGMILTPILGAIAYSQLSNGERIHGIAKYHSWAAITTAAAYGAAILSVTLK